MFREGTSQATALSFFLGSAMLPLSAGAGDYAELAVLGFSPDGQYFAFEEFGIQDGSVFPYSNIYLIDTSTDSWIDGTPIRVLIEGESPPLAETRSESADRFRSFLIEYQIGAEGITVAANPLTETSADPHNVSFAPRPSAINGNYELTLQEYDLPAPAGCPGDGYEYKGFQLTMTDSSGQQSVLSRDTRIPNSRRCPLGYAITEVVIYKPQNRGPVFAVIVSVLSVGFEGPDRRFIAVTGQL